MVAQQAAKCRGGVRVLLRAVTPHQQAGNHAANSCRTMQIAPMSTALLPKGASKSLQCSGCGASLQSHSDTGAGFLPRRAIERVLATQSGVAAAAARASTATGAHSGAAEAAAAATRLICQRCYNAKHYGDLVPVETDEDQFREYIRAIR